MRYFPTVRLCAISLFGLAPGLAAANPTIELYGQFHFGLFSTDDGVESETYLTDNDNSNSRIGFNWTNAFGGGRSLRFNFETGLGFNGSSAVSIDDTDLDLDYSRTELRKFEFIYAAPATGTFSFGQGSMASDGASEADFSGTSVVTYVGIPDLAGSFEYRDGGGAPSGILVGDTFDAFDGARRFRLRYDTPSWNGIVLSFSGGEEILNSGDDNEYYDAGATYAADYGAIKVDARVGYSWSTSGEDLLVGSVAALHEPTGLSLALASGAQQQSTQRGKGEYIYAKIGWQQDWLSYGTTAFSIDLYEGNDFVRPQADSTSIGLAVVQNFDAYNLEVYGGWRTHEFDQAGEIRQDVDVFVVGARWKF